MAEERQSVIEYFLRSRVLPAAAVYSDIISAKSYISRSISDFYCKLRSFNRITVRNLRYRIDGPGPLT